MPGRASVVGLGTWCVAAARASTALVVPAAKSRRTMRVEPGREPSSTCVAPLLGSADDGGDVERAVRSPLASECLRAPAGIVEGAEEEEFYSEVSDTICVSGGTNLG